MDTYAGTIAGFAFNKTIEGWHQCNGGKLALSPQNLAIFQLIKYNYGGTGLHDFALPNVPKDKYGISYQICINGSFPGMKNSPQPVNFQHLPIPPRIDSYTGQVECFSFNFNMRGWKHCDGSLLHIKDNPALFSLLENNFGGDGIDTFALPNIPKTKEGLTYFICVEGEYPQFTT